MSLTNPAYHAHRIGSDLQERRSVPRSRDREINVHIRW